MRSVWSNCFFYAWWEWHCRVHAWRKAGSIKGAEPLIMARPSRSSPRWVPHFLVGTETPGGPIVDIVSFKPSSPVDVPWWRVWQRVAFRGTVREGDVPSSH